MIELTLIGIGTGNPDHLTRQAIRGLDAADLIVIPRKGSAKSDLAELRRTLCADVVTNPATRIVEIDLPHRQSAPADYPATVAAWHRAIAERWRHCIVTNLGRSGRVALLIWGDPSLYDSSLRIADLVARELPLSVAVIPGITAIQALCAAHRIPINEVGEPFQVTTARNLREAGWPDGVNTVVVMLDAGGAFSGLDPAGITIWWGAYLGMSEEVILSGPLAEVGQQIMTVREEERRRHGWIMDTYILRKGDDRRLSDVSLDVT